MGTSKIQGPFDQASSGQPQIASKARPPVVTMGGAAVTGIIRR